MFSLIGHIINKVEFNEEEQTVSLTVDNDKVFLIKVEGDCCSSGKFLDTHSPYDLPSKVVEENDAETSFNTSYGSYAIYQRTYKLENGSEVSFLYDNESNGYYGSSLEAYYNDARVWDFPTEEKVKTQEK